MPTPADFWVAGIAGPNNPALGRSRLYVIDPADPTRPRLVRDLAAVAGIGIGLHATDFERTRTVSPSTDVDFVDGRSVRRIGLRRSEPLVEQQLSAAADACPMFGVRVRHWIVDTEIDLNLQQRRTTTCIPGSTSGVGVTYSHFAQTLGAADPAPTMRWSPLVTPLLDVPNRREIVFDFKQTNPAGRAIYDLTGYRIDGVELGTASGGANVGPGGMTPQVGGDTDSSVLVQRDSATAGTVDLHRLSWSLAGSTLSARIVSYPSTAATAPSAGRLYIGSGRGIVAVPSTANTALPVAALPTADPYRLLATASGIHAFVANSTRCPTAQPCVSLYSTPHAGGTPVQRDLNRGATSPAPLLLLADHDRNQVVVVLPTGGGLQEAVALDVTTGTTRVLVGGIRFVGTVQEYAYATAYDSATIGLLYCTPATGLNTCEGRPLAEYRIRTGTVVTHGTLPTVLRSHPLFAVTDGVPQAVNVGVSGLNSHLFLLTAGRAGSFQLIGTAP